MFLHKQKQASELDSVTKLTFLKDSLSRLKATYASHKAIASNLKSFLAEDISTLGTHRFSKSLDKVLAETELAAAENMLVTHRSELIAHTQALIALILEITATKLQIRNLKDLNAKIAKYNAALETLEQDAESRDQVSRCFLGLPEDHEEQSRKTLAKPFGPFGQEEDEEVQVEDSRQVQDMLADLLTNAKAKSATFEEQDRRIEEEEEAKMKESVDEALRRIDEQERVRKFHWSLVARNFWA